MVVRASNSGCIVDDGYFELGFFSPKVAWSEVVTGVVVVLGVVVMVKKNMGSGRKDDVIFYSFFF